MKHYAFESISHLLEKLQRYSSLWATQNAHKSSSPLKASLRGFWTFIKHYILKKGILYGYKGFIISICNALGVFFKYMKLYENQRQTPSCSLIITTYNQKDRLALVLDSVKALDPLPTEVLIADDGSTKDTQELIESYQASFPCPLLHIWQEDKGFRLCASRNLAIKATQADYIIIIDGDMILESHFIKDHLRFAQKGVFVQGSRVILDESHTNQILKAYQSGDSHGDFRADSTQAFKKAFDTFHIKAIRSHLLSQALFSLSVIKAKVFKHQKLIKGVRGCNMSFYKADCVAINGFNEAFEGWGREDSEFVARFLFFGGELRRLKFAGIAYHLYHPENTRAMLTSNHTLYLETLASRKTFCERGIAQALQPDA